LNTKNSQKFIDHECLLQLPIEIRRGNIAEQVLAFTQNHNSDLENDNKGDGGKAAPKIRGSGWRPDQY
jgi:hypothetical protein